MPRNRQTNNKMRLERLTTFVLASKKKRFSMKCAENDVTMNDVVNVMVDNYVSDRKRT